MPLDITTSTLIGVGSAIFSSGVTYGILKAKVESIEKRLDVKQERINRIERDISEHPEKFVSFNHFDAILAPVQEAIREIKVDIKEVLKLLSRK